MVDAHVLRANLRTGAESRRVPGDHVKIAGQPGKLGSVAGGTGPEPVLKPPWAFRGLPPRDTLSGRVDRNRSATRPQSQKNWEDLASKVRRRPVRVRPSVKLGERCSAGEPVRRCQS